MGANLNKLMQSYGVYTPTVSAYSGVATPDALKAAATAGERGTYQGALADYAAQQAAFKAYETDYKNRIANTNLYTNPGPASTFLSTPNYSDIKGMRANLRDTTSPDTTDYTNPNFSSMINDAYGSLGRVGIGTDTSNIDQPGYDYWMNQLRAGADGGIAPRDFKNRFKIATNDYIRQKPDDDYTKYIQGYLGILPATKMPVLATTGGDTTSGLGGNTGAGGEGTGSPGGSSAYDGGGQPGDLRGPLSSIGGWFGGLLGGSTGAAQSAPQSAAGAYGQLAGASTDQENAAQAAAAEIAAKGAADYGYMARGGPVSSPTSMEEALLRDRSRHEFSDPRFEELYGKYFYADGGGVGGGIANPTDGGSVEGPKIARRRRFLGVTPIYTDAPRVLNYNPAGLPQITGFADPVDPEREGPPGPVPLSESNLRGGGATLELEPPPGTVTAPVTAPVTATAAGPAQSAQSANDAARALDAYRKGLTEQSSSETDPDAAEKWFRLAAAFLSPTKTGKLGEAFSNAAGSEVERRKTENLRKTAAKNKRDEMTLKGLEFDYKFAHDKELTQREDERERNRAALAIHLKGMDSPTFRGVEASDINILLNGDPNSQEYAGAYARRSAPNVKSDGSSVYPNMNWAKVPTFKLNPDSADGVTDHTKPKIEVAQKLIPPAVLKGVTENIFSITQIDQALQELEKYNGSGVGLVVGNLPSAITDTFNSRGVRLRAMIADIGSMKIHDRSGAAVTAAEFPRLRPFIPSPTDSPETIRTKLRQFRDQYINELRDQRSIYNEKSGYKPVDAVEKLLEGNQPPSPADNIINYDRDGKRVAK